MSEYTVLKLIQEKSVVMLRYLLSNFNVIVNNINFLFYSIVDLLEQVSRMNLFCRH